MRILTFIVSCCVVTAAFSAERVGISPTNAIAEAEAAIMKQLRSFEADKEVDHLTIAFNTARRLDQTAQQGAYSPEADLAKIRLMLMIAERCSIARDRAYDLSKMPDYVVNVRPPFSAGQNAYPRMPPSDIQDPHARREYEQAIAENDRKRKKHFREREFKRIVDRTISDARFFLQLARHEPQRHAQIMQVFTNTVQQPEMRALLVSDR